MNTLQVVYWEGEPVLHYLLSRNNVERADNQRANRAAKKAAKQAVEAKREAEAKIEAEAKKAAAVVKKDATGAKKAAAEEARQAAVEAKIEAEAHEAEKVKVTQKAGQNQRAYKARKTVDDMSKENRDARDYDAEYTRQSVFFTCCVCLHEGGMDDMQSNREVAESAPELHNARHEFITKLEDMLSDRSLYKEAYLGCFNASGYLKTGSHLCKRCYKQMKQADLPEYDHHEMFDMEAIDSSEDDIESATPHSRNKRKPRHQLDRATSAEISDDGDTDVDESETEETLNDVDDDAVSKSYMPKQAALNYLHPGLIPEELSDLNVVELSMIAIFNPILNITTLPSYGCRGVNGGARYTVVNDVAKVAKSLPRMPDVDTTCILRHKTNRNVKDHTFRPLRVQRALEWLIMHNHLYRSAVADGSLDIDFSVLTQDMDDVEGTIKLAPQFDINDDEDKLIGETTVDKDPTDDTTDLPDILLQTPPPMLNELNHLKEVVLQKPTPVIYKADSTFEYAHPYNDCFFYEKCFPNIFPYGCGGPSDTHGLDNNEFVRLSLERGGDRRFQKSANYIFCFYTYVMRRKVGGVTATAAKSYLDSDLPNPSDQENISVDDVIGALNTLRSDNDISCESSSRKSVFQQHLDRVLNRLVAYGRSLPGTSIFIKHERRKLLSMVSSKMMQAGGALRYFLTFAPADRYHNRLYATIIRDQQDQREDSISDTEKNAAKYDQSERTTMLRDHPALACRLFHKKQECIWKKLITSSKSHPFGSKVVDWWRRIEFQMRGSPHCHSLLWICNALDGITKDHATSKDPEKQEQVKRCVEKVATCKLMPKNSEDHYATNNDGHQGEDKSLESHLSWLPGRNYFKDRDHPCKPEFSLYMDGQPLDFSPSDNWEEKTNGELASDESLTQGQKLVQVWYRRLQLANQIHRCTQTCFKYSKSVFNKVCRFGFSPKGWIGGPTSTDEATLVVDKDGRGRKRIQILPPRDNMWLNNYIKTPLIPIATGGNLDIKYIDNQVGAAEYCASYASKAEAPDSAMLKNLVTRKIANLILQSQSITDKQRLSIVANSLVDSTQVGAMQACWTLLGLPFVQSSRGVLSINTAVSKDVPSAVIVDEDKLKELKLSGGTQSAIDSSPRSQMGRRVAYGKFVRQQNTIGGCQATFHQMLTYFSLRTFDTNKFPSDSKLPIAPVRILLDAQGKPSYLDKFRVDDVVFTPYQSPKVISLCPYYPQDLTDEESCYSTVLLHTIWPNGQESQVLPPDTTAIVHLDTMIKTKSMPPYVTQALETIQKSETILRNVGKPTFESVPGNHDGNDDYQPGSVPDEFRNTAHEKYSFQSDTNVICNVSLNQKAYLANFLSSNLKAFMDNLTTSNRATTEDDIINIQQGRKVPVNSEESSECNLDRMVDGMTSMQRTAYDKISSHLTGENPNQLRIFVSGEGGTGKSHLIKAVREKAQLVFGKARGIHGNTVVMAPTGNAAFNISGYTWQSALVKAPQDGDITTSISQNKADVLARNLKDCKLVIIDEISMISLSDLYNIHIRLCAANSTRENFAEVSKIPFGGMHIIILGDLYQLPAMGTSVYQTPVMNNKNPKYYNACLNGKNLWNSITTYIELTENVRHQAKIGEELPPLARICSTARKGLPTVDQFAELWSRCLCSGVKEAQRKAPVDAMWVAATHERVNEINKMCFENLVESGATHYRIHAQHYTSTGESLSDEVHTKLSKITTSGTKALPEHNDLQEQHLDLAIGSRVMSTMNSATQLGVYNGAQGTVIGFGFQGQSYENNMPTVSQFIEGKFEIPIVFVQMDGGDGWGYKGDSVSPTLPRIVPFVAESCKTKLCGKYTRKQLKLRTAHCITIHKSQGLTAKNGLVLCPTETEKQCFAPGLEYVALSRAQKIEDVYLTRPLANFHFAANRHIGMRTAIKAEYNRLSALTGKHFDVYFDPIIIAASTPTHHPAHVHKEKEKPTTPSQKPTKQPAAQTTCHSGLVNLGNTCYFNAIIQFLTQCPRYLESEPTQSPQAAFSKTDQLFYLIRGLTNNITTGTLADPRITLELVKQLHPNYNNSLQHDASEFFVDILETFKHVKPASTFMGSYKYTAICNNKTCGHQTYQLQDNPVMIINILQTYKKRETLKSCINHAMSSKAIPTWICSQCGQKSDKNASIMSFQILPETLVIVLSKTDNSGNILPTEVDIQHVLTPKDLKLPTSEIDAAYELCAIVKRIGTHVTSGHYTTCLRNTNNTWIHCNDDSITPIVKKDLYTDAYMLLYRKKPNLSQTPNNFSSQSSCSTLSQHIDMTTTSTTTLDSQTTSSTLIECSQQPGNIQYTPVLLPHNTSVVHIPWENNSCFIDPCLEWLYQQSTKHIFLTNNNTTSNAVYHALWARANGGLQQIITSRNQLRDHLTSIDPSNCVGANGTFGSVWNTISYIFQHSPDTIRMYAETKAICTQCPYSRNTRVASHPYPLTEIIYTTYVTSMNTTIVDPFKCMLLEFEHRLIRNCTACRAENTMENQVQFNTAPAFIMIEVGNLRTAKPGVPFIFNPSLNNNILQCHQNCASYYLSGIIHFQNSHFYLDVRVADDWMHVNDFANHTYRRIPPPCTPVDTSMMFLYTKHT